MTALSISKSSKREVKPQILSAIIARNHFIFVVSPGFMLTIGESFVRQTKIGLPKVNDSGVGLQGVFGMLFGI